MLLIFSGLRKAKQNDWKDYNLALFGSGVEKNVKSMYIYLPVTSILQGPGFDPSAGPDLAGYILFGQS